jgi:diguanylate cyclase (GGDEF)-like protein
MLDLDRFKAVNDSHGHEGGDAVIRHIAGMIRDALRKIDQAGRLGGEEFAILLTGADGEAAQTFAERLRLRVAQTPAMYRRQPIPMTLSIGITPLTAADTNIDEVLRRADTALYQAKAAGRDSVVVAPQQCSE